MRAIFLAAVLVAAGTTLAHAQSIERACLRSDREASDQALCGCIQQAANLTLNTRDQKLASTFYRTPQKAQDIRQSSRPSHVQFWLRYKDFLETAQAFCK